MMIMTSFPGNLYPTRVSCLGRPRIQPSDATKTYKATVWVGGLGRAGLNENDQSFWDIYILHPVIEELL